MSIIPTSDFQELFFTDTQTGTLNCLPDELLLKIFESLEMIRNLTTLRLVSKRFKWIIDDRVKEKISLFSKISYYVPRSLTDEEEKLPHLQQLYIATQLISQTDSLRRTPLIKATIAAKIKLEALEAMLILCVLGADINQKSPDGITAAQYADYWNIEKAIVLLRQQKK